jgi:folate-binding protein YgfZ
VTSETGAPSIVFADLSAWRKIAVTGVDAFQWLNDLVSADLSALSPGTSRRSLLLSPTGRIRAEFTAARLDTDSFLLIQDPDQRSPIERLLEPYTLSSDVELTDRTTELQLFAFPDLLRPLADAERTWLRPSVLGPGLDLLSRAPAAFATTVAITKLSPEELDRRRVLEGTPRLGIDVREEDLPQEACLADAVSFEKGCYLGQEAVAKVRNLGHPRRVLLRIRTAASIEAGDAVFVDGQEVGRVTSAVRLGDGSAGLASVRWAAREGPFRTNEGAELGAQPLP